jgi:L-ascorbate metabolism protein UlaG (beta-lactamase superfamily)
MEPRWRRWQRTRNPAADRSGLLDAREPGAMARTAPPARARDCHRGAAAHRRDFYQSQPLRSSGSADGGLWLTLGARSLYFCGDSGHGPLFAELRRRCGVPEIALLPIGAYEPRWFMHEQHMNPAEAVQAHVTLGARLSLGCHFGCFPLTDEGIDDPFELAQALAAQGLSSAEFRTLAPGETLLWRGDSRPLHVTA